jgi:hypothetical protein
MTRNISATSIKHDHLLRWGGQMYYHEKARNDNYVGRRETPSLGGASVPVESSSRDDRQEGVLPSHYESKLVISACSGVSLVPSAWFRYSSLERERKQSSIPGGAGGRAIAASSAKAHRGIHFQGPRACPHGWALTIQRNDFAAEARRTA